MSFLVAILLTVTLQPPFGEAEAKDLGSTIGMSIDVSVQVEGAPAAVLARVTTVGGELDPIALVPRGIGSYAQAIRLTEREDVTIAFEYIGADGTTVISAGSTLTDLGVDPEVFGSRVPVVAPEEETGISPWLLAGLAAALAAVVLMGIWSTGSLGLAEKESDWTFAGTNPDRLVDPEAEDAEDVESADVIPAEADATEG